MRFSTWHPITYTLSIFVHRLIRRVHLFGRPLARQRSKVDLSFRVARHQSVLLRKLGNADMRLQQNKIINLRLAAQAIDGVLIQPDETVSFWSLVGNPTKRCGYVSGMLLSNGNVTEGIGGGLCQMANILYWMALH
ncbi:MAG: VanW family protein, partial [Candidatus Uhrbacteria bacterium]|nr:VanW family protein [Candidatus Uhrbacteria bacterium]